MKFRRSLAHALLVSALSLPVAHGMGLRSFVALPVDKGGTVLRAAIEHNTDTDTNLSLLNAAHGINHRQTLLFGVPYRLSSGEGDRMGDVSALYRHIVLQSDQDAGTDRLGLLGGVIIPTDSDRDEAMQVGAVFTRFRGRNEIDLDVLYQQGLGNRDNTARYDLSWQHRVRPSEYPEWGIPPEWYVVTELGGRWSEAHSTVHQFTVGFQRVVKRWVFEGGVIQDLNDPNHTRFLFSVRFH
jgi:hypothetical protein